MINCENVGGQTAKSCLSEASNANNNDLFSSTKVCNCTRNCSTGIFITDVEGLKLSMAILEKRLNLLNSCYTMNSELVSPRNKQYDMEATVPKQQEYTNQYRLHQSYCVLYTIHLIASEMKTLF